jgi:hypothetical protein
MTDTDLKAELGDYLIDYRRLEKLSAASPADHLLGSALDAAAGVLAAHIFLVTDKVGLTHEMWPAMDEVNFRYSYGRESLALRPILAMIEGEESLEAVTRAMLAGMTADHVDKPHRPQLIEEALDEMGRLLEVTGTGGVWGDVMFTARENAEWYIDMLRTMDIVAPPPPDPIVGEARAKACRDAVMSSFVSILTKGQAQGWTRAELLQAIFSVADETIKEDAEFAKFEPTERDRSTDA